MFTTDKIRNIAIIAHVDHGKTTIVDALLKQSHTFRDNQSEMSQQLLMDSNDQEKERGITIQAKQTAITYEGYRINIIDTPGHADFSGEVERTLNMADACLLIVDAQEGPMPQTKFVLKKALENHLKPFVVINKIDKNDSNIFKVEDEVSDLFLELATDESQLHYPIFYAVGRDGKIWDSKPEDINEDADMRVILDAIITDIPQPKGDSNNPLQMLVTALAWDSFLGKYAIGRIAEGSMKPGDQVSLINREGIVSKAKVDKLFVSQGLAKIPIEGASAGEIIALTGIADARIGDTIASAENPVALPTINIEEPTLKISLSPNTSPFKGLEGEFTTSRQIGDRLKKELETNVGLKVEPEGIGFLVSGRGELHLSVLIETMRREGYEFEVGRPTVVTKVVDGLELEPIEEVTVEVDDAHVGAVQQEFGLRRAELTKQEPLSGGQTRLLYKMPTKSLIGMSNILLTATRGTVQVHSLHIGYEPLSPALSRLRNGALVAWENGVTTAYALQTAEQRGICFVEPAQKVYAGQVVGVNGRGDDLEINVAKEKHLTNMRSSSSDGTVRLTPATILSLEQSLDFIEDDELVEVTPKSLRIRKKLLNHSERKRNAK
ncbi:translational GTPase TypA [Candidatus Saccharibacteria bacterium]|jgi:GTP-binding protein|nr:translational GTPase TypA [Candidatus Saccharibacteria bacterium]